MRKLKDWNVCFEVGLNHLGYFENVLNIIKESRIQDIPCALSIQIREESFYQGSKKNLALNIDEYLSIRKLCADLGIPFGLALGPLRELDWLVDSNLSPDFLKLIYIATNDLEFIGKVKQSFKCTKYFSVGLSDYDYIRKKIIPLMGNDDMIIHTSLSHETLDQNLGEIKRLELLGKTVCFGQHAIEKEVCLAAIGAGAKKVFVYIGDKTLDLPDYNHAVSSSTALNFYNQCSTCFKAMQEIGGSSKISKIAFLD